MPLTSGTQQDNTQYLQLENENQETESIRSKEINFNNNHIF